MKVPARFLGGLIVGLVIALIVAAIFSLGMLMGQFRAGYPLHPGFGPARGGFPRWTWRLPLGHRGYGRHGALGEVGKIEEERITITERRGTTKVIVVTEDTAIGRDKERIELSDIRVGDWLLVIGSPGEQGEIKARLIRLLKWDRTSWKVERGAFFRCCHLHPWGRM